MAFEALTGRIYKLKVKLDASEMKMRNSNIQK